MKLAVGLAGVALVGWMLYASLQHDQHRYEVCVSFQGRTHCATGAGPTPEEAVRTAQAVACTMLASGRDDNIRCLDTRPSSVRPLAGR
jgi:hypothetical protein